MSLCRCHHCHSDCVVLHGDGSLQEEDDWRKGRKITAYFGFRFSLAAVYVKSVFVDPDPLQELLRISHFFGNYFSKTN